MIDLNARTYPYSHTIGIDDFSGRSFRNAVDLAVGKEDVLYVLQRGVEMQRNLAVKICNVNEEYFGDFGSYGTGPGEWIWPGGIAVDANHRLYISDEWNQKITIFDEKGNFLSEWGEAGTDHGQLNRPNGLAFDNNQRLLVVDALNHRIQRFEYDGTFIDAWGQKGTKHGQFDMPWGVAVSPEGHIFVSDWRNDRIQKFDEEGRVLLAWGCSGVAEGEFDRPAGIAVDSTGDVYVADWRNHRIQIFNSDGVFRAQLNGEATMSKWGEQLLSANPLMMEERRVAKDLNQEKTLWHPRSIKVDSQGRIIIVDSGRGRLQVYQKP